MAFQQSDNQWRYRRLMVLGALTIAVACTSPIRIRAPLNAQRAPRITGRARLIAWNPVNHQRPEEGTQ